MSSDEGQRRAGGGEQVSPAPHRQTEGTAPTDRTVRQRVADYCLPEERNVHGPERAGRVVAGVAVGAFGIIGVIAAERPILGASLGAILLIVTAYLLATAKTQKCPVKHVTRQGIPAR